jgi:hypothetical protein
VSNKKIQKFDFFLAEVNQILTGLKSVLALALAYPVSPQNAEMWISSGISHRHPD